MIKKITIFDTYRVFRQIVKKTRRKDGKHGNKTGNIYTFENICKEDNGISMGDGAVKLFLNANGTQDDVSKELKAFLDYVAGEKSEDSFVEK